MVTYNAAGIRSKEIEDLEKLLDSKISVITIGSITLEPRSGNKVKTYWLEESSGDTLNSIGLENRGLEHYKNILPKFLAVAESRGKKVRVSVAANSPGEYTTLVKGFLDIGIKEIEINGSCPNVWEEGKQKVIPTFNISLLKEIVEAVSSVSQEPIFDYKLSPISDPKLVQGIASLFSEVQHIRAVVTSNTFPNAYSDKTGLAGLGGSAMRHIALGQVNQFRKLLPARIKLVGVGGISNRRHVEEFSAAGAEETQVGSYYFQNGPKIFEEEFS